MTCESISRFSRRFSLAFFPLLPTLPISWVEILLWTKNNKSENKKKEKRKIVKSRRKIAFIIHLSSLAATFIISTLTLAPTVMHNANSICDKLQSVVFMPCAGGYCFILFFDYFFSGLSNKFTIWGTDIE